MVAEGGKGVENEERRGSGEGAEEGHTGGVEKERRSRGGVKDE